MQRDALITTADIESVRFYIQVRGDVRFAGKIIMLTFNDTEEKAVEKVRPVRQSAGQGTAKFFTLLLLLYLCPFPVSQFSRFSNKVIPSASCRKLWYTTRSIPDFLKTVTAASNTAFKSQAIKSR